MNHVEINNPSDCCGCRNCENICPNNAIKMTENSEGFIYPTIDTKLCVDCGLCKNACPWISRAKKENYYLESPMCYAAKAAQMDLQKKGSSGGMFGVFANYIISNNGVVCGATMDTKLNVKHIIVDNINDLDKLYGSKYVASDLKDVFISIKNELQIGKLVLFSGVPCQVNALLKFLSKKYDNLITIEIICHGVPSQKSFNKYLEYLEKKNKFKILKYEFRNKQAAPWGTYKGLVTYEKNGKILQKTINADFDKYYKNFLEANGYRESCYNCKYAQRERYADITLGDFWGIEKILPEFVDYNGISEIIINSEKGKEIFDTVKANIVFKEVKFDEIVKYNGQLEKPSTRENTRDNWYDNIDNDSFIKNIKVNKNIRSYIKVIFPNKLKFEIKKFLKK